MKSKIIYVCVLGGLQAIASSGIYLPVYSYEQSSSPLHVQEFSTAELTDNAVADLKQWTFPPEYTGKRSVCYLPGASTNMTFIA